MQRSSSTPIWLIILVVFLGVIAISTGAIFVRLAVNGAGQSGFGFSLVIAAFRLTLAALILLPIFAKIEWRSLQTHALFYAAAAGACLALHFATWITSLSYTSIAASTTLVTTSPIWVALLSRFWLKETLSKLTAIGIVIALSGSLLIGIEDLKAASFTDNQNPLLGDSLALMGAWAISLYFLLGREAQQRGLTIGGYAAIAYSVAALILLPLPLVFNTPYIGYPSVVYLYLFLMAMVPQLIGHTSFNWAVNQISPTLVTLAILFEPVGASFLGYLLFEEVPSLPTIMGAIIILLGVAIAAFSSQRQKT